MTAFMEKRARAIFREALLVQYIDGIPVGDEVETWLKKHGGWFPDEQEDYGYGCMMPEAVGAEIMSTEPEKAIEDAKRVMSCLDEAIEDEDVELKTSAQKGLADFSRDWAAQAAPAQAAPMLTEANLEARDFRLKFAHETLQSFKERKERDRSRRPRPTDFEKAVAKIESIYTRRIDDLKYDLMLKDIEIRKLQGFLSISENFIGALKAIIDPKFKCVRPSAFDVSQKDKCISRRYTKQDVILYQPH